jgi:hypothetical protein
MNEAFEYEALLQLLQQRFSQNMNRHQGIAWEEVKARLLNAPQHLRALQAMEDTGGAPDVIGTTPAGAYIFCDCAPESPKDRRSLCYDREALLSRKDAPPSNNVLDVASQMGIELLDETAYRALQALGEFDTKTSSWIKTPDDIRKLGGALFADRRYGHVFVYHNGASSYYAARGFRGMIAV